MRIGWNHETCKTWTRNYDVAHQIKQDLQKKIINTVPQMKKEAQTASHVPNF